MDVGKHEQEGKKAVVGNMKDLEDLTRANPPGTRVEKIADVGIKARTPGISTSTNTTKQK